MISNFSLKGFRGFKSFSLPDFKTVNVFVGKNNAGKSSLLEALHLHVSRCDFDVLQSIAIRRGEMSDQVVDPRMRDSFQIDFSHFFNGHRIGNGKSFTLGTDHCSYTARIKAAEQGQAQELLSFEDADGRIARHTRYQMEVMQESSGANHLLQSAQLSDEGGVVTMRRFVRPVNMRTGRNLFITPDSLESTVLASLWNNIIFRNDEQVIVRALKLLEPRVNSVAFLLSEQSSFRYFSRSPAGVLLGLEGEPKRLPLGSLGDGMKRLLAIALALANARNGGSVFIDEVDAGFHYSVMRDLWRLIISTAVENNVQVFVSTHSLDCLRGLQVIGAMPTARDAVSLYTVNTAHEAATRYSSSEIQKIIEHEVEVR